MNISNVEIAQVAMCSEGAVRKAVERRRLDPESLLSVMGFVFALRMKNMGMRSLDEVAEVSAAPKQEAGRFPKTIEELRQSGLLTNGAAIHTEEPEEYIVDRSESQE